MAKISFIVALLVVLTSYIIYFPSNVIRLYLQCLFLSETESSHCLLSENDTLSNSVQEIHTSRNITLFCHFQPLQGSFEVSKEITLSMQGLLMWQNPHEHNITLKTKDFTPLVPHTNARVGMTWYIVEPVKYPETSSEDLSMRYRDQRPQNNTAASVLYRILSMFHKNIFLQTRFAPRGTLAVLRAQNSVFLDIAFRCHAEFQLNNPPLLPFWFTPSQFQGHIIIARDSSKILNFTVTVPTHRKLNVDMEWVEKLHENMVVEIGFVPKMLIQNAATANNHRISWNEEISMQEAHTLLEQKMFPFKEDLKAHHNILAAQLLDSYSFPVTSIILSPDGNIVHSLNANDMLSEITGDVWMRNNNPIMNDPIENEYFKFLQTALEKYNSQDVNVL